MQSLNKLPEQLKTLRQWLCWRKVPKTLADGSTRIGKVPINPVRGIILAGWQEERHWLTFIQVLKYHNMNKCDGIGFVFNGQESFSGIDLDKCISNGVVQPWAQNIVDHMSSYTERSPSGVGLRIFIGGKPANVVTKAKKALGNGTAVEIFSGTGCFLTTTGDTVNETAMRSDQTAIDWLMETYFKDHGKANDKFSSGTGPRKTNLSRSDTELLDKARKAKNGQKFVALYDCGDVSRYGDDHTSADLALISLLLYWCDGDADRADHLFRGSALMREKWDEKHGQSTYGQQTLHRAGTKQR